MSDLLALIDEIEMHCPCGARPESLSTHPHAPGCLIHELKLALAERAAPSAPEPWIYAIEEENKEGVWSWHDGEQCVFGDKVSAQDEVDMLNDDFDGEEHYRVVPLYRALAAAQPGEVSVEQVRSVLSKHWLSGIHCHHAISPDDSTYDWASCACSKVNLPHKGTVGEAVGTWIEHIISEFKSSEPAVQVEGAGK